MQQDVSVARREGQVERAALAAANGGVPASVTVIIPAYNERDTIGGVLADLSRFIASRPDVAWDVIVIDDCSTDGTDEVVRAVPDVRLIRLPQNRGYGAALKAGIRAARGDFVMCMDGDGQHIAAEIGKFLPGAVEFDMTAGSRAANAVPIGRRPGKAVLWLLLRFLIPEQIPDINCGQRLFRRETIGRYLNVCSNRFSFSMSSTISLMSEGHFVRFVDIECRPRVASKSRVNLSAGLQALLMIIRMAILFHPLRVLLPIAAVSGTLLAGSLLWDFHTMNVSKLTLLLSGTTFMSLMFGFLFDQISHIRRQLP